MGICQRREHRSLWCLLYLTTSQETSYSTIFAPLYCECKKKGGNTPSRCLSQLLFLFSWKNNPDLSPSSVDEIIFSMALFTRATTGRIWFDRSLAPKLAISHPHRFQTIPLAHYNFSSWGLRPMWQYNCCGAWHCRRCSYRRRHHNKATQKWYLEPPPAHP
jgi:hypothetical protein